MCIITVWQTFGRPHFDELIYLEEPSFSFDLIQGFDDGVSTVWDGAKGIHSTIKTLIEEKGKHRKLFITGHSLGGALATIAAARLAFVDDLKIHAMYTIGSPRYGRGPSITPTRTSRKYGQHGGSRPSPDYSYSSLSPSVPRDFTRTMAHNRCRGTYGERSPLRRLGRKRMHYIIESTTLTKLDVKSDEKSHDLGV